MQTHFSPVPTLTTERLLLRPLVDTDAPEIFIQRSDERILQYTQVPKALDLDDAVKFIDMILDLAEKGESLYWAICRKGEQKLIGTICLWHLDKEKTTAEIGFTMHPDYWGQGLTTEAVRAVTEFGFEKMGANIIEASSNEQNLASIKLLEKVGFVKTGIEEQYGSFAYCRPPLGAVLLETGRLRLREITPSDAPFLLELLNSPGWQTNIGDRGVHNLDDARKYAIYRIWLICRLKGFSFNLLERKSDSALLGMCGLIKRDFLDDVDIGYALLPQHYGQGYAVEAAKAVADYANEKLKLPRLAAITIESNKPSQRVLEKIGLRFERMISVPDDDEELMLFGVDF